MKTTSSVSGNTEQSSDRKNQQLHSGYIQGEREVVLRSVWLHSALLTTNLDLLEHICVDSPVDCSFCLPIQSSVNIQHTKSSNVELFCLQEKGTSSAMVSISRLSGVSF